MGQRDELVGVLAARAESTATTLLPSSALATMRRAARLMRSASATEVPPNFITTVSAAGEDIRRQR